MRNFAGYALSAFLIGIGFAGSASADEEQRVAACRNFIDYVTVDPAKNGAAFKQALLDKLTSIHEQNAAEDERKAKYEKTGKRKYMAIPRIGRMTDVCLEVISEAEWACRTDNQKGQPLPVWCDLQEGLHGKYDAFKAKGEDAFAQGYEKGVADARATCRNKKVSPRVSVGPTSVPTDEKSISYFNVGYAKGFEDGKLTCKKKSGGAVASDKGTTRVYEGEKAAPSNPTETGGVPYPTVTGTPKARNAADGG